jgi:hypothetical protein
VVFGGWGWSIGKTGDRGGQLILGEHEHEHEHEHGGVECETFQFGM